MRRIAIAAAIALVGALYLADLTGMGMVSKDEPRYADIGRAMAQSGDWITPRLWGKPWFEKPPLLYWMTALGFRLGMGPDLAPRLPVAILSLAFLGFFWYRLKGLWNPRVATFSTAILATTAGWLAFAHVAVTDLPLAVLFSAAVLLSLEPDGDRTLPAAFLGLAILAKSLVPAVLFLPVLALDYRRLRQWFRPAPVLAFLLVTLPWHALCTARNGTEFLRVLFIEHQFGRFTSGALQHIQHWWYYVPVALLLLYPWFPLLALVPRDWNDRRTRILMAVVAFGFVFFSASVNKLPGYLLPLLPSTCVLMGLGLANARNTGRALILPVALLGILPLGVKVVPGALANGLRATSIPFGAAALWLAVACLIAALIGIFLKTHAFAVAGTLAALAWLWFQIATFPSLDAAASARPVWIAKHPVCASSEDAKVLFSLYYYAGGLLPECDVLDQPATRVVR